MKDTTTLAVIIIGICLIVIIFFVVRCFMQVKVMRGRRDSIDDFFYTKKGKACPSRCSVEGKTALVTAADSAVGIELTRELCRRGARVIMAVKDTELGQDVAVEVRGETNGEVVVEYCDMASLKSVRDFCTKILEQVSALRVRGPMARSVRDRLNLRRSWVQRGWG